MHRKAFIGCLVGGLLAAARVGAQTGRMARLGLTIPASLLVRADEVIR